MYYNFKPIEKIMKEECENSNYVQFDYENNFFYKWFQLDRNGKPLADKWRPYFEMYQDMFFKYKNKDFVFVEIGVQSGGSTYMWQDYFGKGLKYFGFDINKNCKQFEREKENIKIYIGDQSNVNDLKTFISKVPRPDVILDDGGHTMKQQITTFEQFWPWLKDDGIYCCEDLHTSYMGQFGGGVKREDTFIEYLKDIIDIMHYNHQEIKGKKNDYYQKTIKTIHILNSIVCIEKTSQTKWERLMSGTYKIPYEGRK